MPLSKHQQVPRNGRQNTDRSSPPQWGQVFVSGPVVQSRHQVLS